MEEIWKVAIENEPYEISNLGNLRRGEKIIKGSIGCSGYRRFNIFRNKKGKCYKFHILVARVFIGERPEGLVIDHINRDKLDNRVENLRYITQKENMLNTNHYKEGVERWKSGKIKYDRSIKGIRKRGMGSLYNFPNGNWRGCILKNKINKL